MHRERPVGPILNGLPSTDYGVPPKGRPKGVPNPLSSATNTVPAGAPGTTPNPTGTTSHSQGDDH